MGRNTVRDAELMMVKRCGEQIIALHMFQFITGPLLVIIV